MKVYQADQYDIFVAEVELNDSDLDPENPGEYLIPGGCYTFAPGPAESGHAWQLNSEKTAWLKIEDHRYITYWFADGSEHTVVDVGPLPSGALLVKPPKVNTPEENAAIKAGLINVANNQISILTDATDPEIVEVVNPDDAALLVLWKKYRQALRLVVTTVNPVAWPAVPAYASGTTGNDSEV